MNRLQELQGAIKIANAGQHYLKLKDESDFVSLLCGEIDTLRQQLATVTAERDEQAEFSGNMLVAAAENKTRADKAEAQLATVTQERDEARAEVVSLNAGMNDTEANLRATEDQLSQLRTAGEGLAWRDISTAPKDGSEILGYREDCGAVIMRWGAPCDFLNERELEGVENADEPDWFCADFVCGAYRMSNDGLPTHWLPVPAFGSAALSSAPVATGTGEKVATAEDAAKLLEKKSRAHWEENGSHEHDTGAPGPAAVVEYCDMLDELAEEIRALKPSAPLPSRAEDAKRLENLVQLLRSSIRFNKTENRYEWVIRGATGDMNQSVEQAIIAALQRPADRDGGGK